MITHSGRAAFNLLKHTICTALILFTFGAGVGGGTPLPSGQRRVALVIGNDRYPSSPLQNAVNDATSIAEALRRRSFEVTLVTNADLETMKSNVEQFTLHLNKDDIGLLFYSGHGMQLDGENYLIPTDFLATNQVDARYAAYSLSTLSDRMAARNPALSIIVLDACRNNPFLVSRGFSRGWAPMTTRGGTFIAFATSPGQTASDNSLESNGLFTKFLLKEMTVPDMGLDALFAKVRMDVYGASRHTQLPWTASSVIGDFYFTNEQIAPAGDQPATETIPPMSGLNIPRYNPPRERSLPRVAPSTTIPFGQDTISPKALMARGRLSLEMRDLSSADADFSRILSKEPEQEDALRERCHVRLLMNQGELAVDDCTAAVDLAPQDYIARQYRSVGYILSRSYVKAAHDSTVLIQAEPSLAVAYLYRSLAFLGLGRFEQAERDASAAIERDRKLSLAYAARGRAKQAQGRIAEARVDFDTASNLEMAVPPSPLNSQYNSPRSRRSVASPADEEQ